MKNEAKVKKKGGCLGGLFKLGLILAAGFCGLVLVIALLDTLGFIESDRDSEQGGSVVVLPSRTPAVTPSVTPIPLPTNTPDMLTSLNNVEPGREIVQAEVFELAQRAQIVFVMGQDLDGAEAYMLKVICAIRGYLPAGYGIRFAGDRGDGIELMTAIVDAPAIQALTCPASVDFASIATEYDFVEGLR